MREKLKNKTKKQKLKIALAVFAVLCVLGASGVFGVDLYVKNSAKDRIITSDEATKIDDIDCVLVLGCGVRGDQPSPMLNDRILGGVELYKIGAAPKIIMSGDHGRTEYDEVNVMKRVAIENGVESSDVFMDHAGFSTYDSLYRAKEIFQTKKIIIVTQKYHLYRALYIAEKLGLEAYGVNSDPQLYAGQMQRNVREILARDKDFVKCIIKPQSTCLGEVIPVSGNGDLTNDKT